MLTPINYIVDFDSTIIQCESLDELARIALRHNSDQKEIMTALEQLTIDGMNGRIAFDESLQRRLGLFQATRNHVDELTKYLRSQLTTSLKDDATWFSTNREHIYIVSGGFEDYIVPIVKLLGIEAEHVFANRFTYDEVGCITGYDSTSLLSRQNGKSQQVNALKLSGTVVMIGDGYTDYEVKAHDAAHEFWAFTENVRRERVIEKADKIIAAFPS